MTINKSQGQELEKVGIYLNRACFGHGHGQLYVAFSREHVQVKTSRLKHQSKEKIKDTTTLSITIVTFSLSTLSL